MRYRSEDIDNLISQLKIEEVVGEFVPLKKAGANYKGLCPFHKDTSPSFMVSPSKNICKCFVCEAGGNPVKFYAEYKKINFYEAAEELAKKYDIPLREVKTYGKKEEDYSKFYEIMEEAQKFFCDKIFSLQGREALEYLSKRDISPQFIKDNSLGFAGHGRTELHDHMVSLGYAGGDLLTLGLIKANENGYYDAFRGRIMFPIHSPGGKVIGFGGRTTSTDKNIPKYINSPETPIFKKGKNLYGIKDRGNSLKSKNYSILMEGYMDVLTAHLFGFDGALAPLGTALTEDQGKLLKKYTNNVILSFDMDTAGKMATERASLILKGLGFNIRVLHLEGAKDPDEFLRAQGKEKFLEAVKNSMEIFDYLYSSYSKEYNLEDHMAKQNFINRFKDFFQVLSTDLEKALYLDKLSKSLDIDRDTLKEILIDKNRVKAKSFEEKPVLEKKADVVSPLEELTLALIFSKIDYLKYFKEKDYRSTFIKKGISFLETLWEKEEEVNSNNLKEFMKKENLSLAEQEKIIEISLTAHNDFSQERNRQKGLAEIFTLWFIIELRELKKQRLDIMINLKLKKIEEKLKKDGEFQEILELYKEFLKYYRGGFI